MRVELVLADVHHGQHRLVGEQEVRLAAASRCVGVEAGPVQRRALGQRRVGGLERGDLVGQRPVGSGRLAAPVEPPLDRLEVGQRQLDLDDAQVLERVGRAGDVVVVERPQHEHDGVDLADAAEEPVAEALALAGALDQAADVDHLHRGVHDVLGSSTSRPGGRGAGRAPWRRRRWGPWWRRCTGRPGRRRRSAR